MKIKKEFKLIEDYQEETFLNEQLQAGYLLTAFDGENYRFEKTKTNGVWMIEYRHQEMDNHERDYYNHQGFKLACVYKSEKGYYYYLIHPDQHIDLDKYRNPKDRYELVETIKNRFDRFAIVIVLSSFTLFSYMYFKYKSPVYFIVLGMVVLVASYLASSYIRTIKRLNVYGKILNEKRGSQPWQQ